MSKHSYFNVIRTTIKFTEGLAFGYTLTVRLVNYASDMHTSSDRRWSLCGSEVGDGVDITPPR